MHAQPGKERAETLDYIQSMLGQLRTMAQAERADMLAYLLEMAFLEAGEAASGTRAGSIGQEGRKNTA